MGEIRAQKPGRQHQVVVFVFTGDISAQDTRAWNEAIRQLKQKFAGRVKGHTITGGKAPKTK